MNIVLTLVHSPPAHLEIILVSHANHICALIVESSTYQSIAADSDKQAIRDILKKTAV